METDFIFFINLVEKMRVYQHQYFITRNNEILKLCKQLEKQADDFIKHQKKKLAEEIEEKPKPADKPQGTLF